MKATCGRTHARFVAVGAVASAAILVASCGGKGEKETVVARVGNGVITAEQMEARMRSFAPQVAQHYQGEEGQAALLDGFIEEEAWYQEGLRLGIDKDPDVSRQIDDAIRRVVIQNYFARELRPYQVLTEEELREHYEEDIDSYTKAKEMKVRHIQTDTVKEAELMRESILNGGDMAALAQKYSTNELTAQKGGLIGYVPAKATLIPFVGSSSEMAHAIDSLPIMAVSDVLKSPLGYQVLRVEEVIPEGPIPFEKVKDLVRRSVQPEHDQTVRAERLAEIKDRLGVQIVETGLLQTAEAREEKAQELFQKAQESTDWQTRLDLYNEFLTKYPDHARYSEALFMIGFIQAEELRDFAGAQETFMKLLKEYPDSKLAKDAKFMLDNLGGKELPKPEMSGTEG